MACIKAEHECSAAYTGILLDLCSGFDIDIHHLSPVYIFVALWAEAIGFDAFFKLVSPISGTRHVIIMVFLVWPPCCKLRELSQLIVVDVVEDQADLLVGFEEASSHA